MIELAPPEFARALPLLAGSQQKVLPYAICEGLNPGRVFVDRRDNPQTALIWTPVGYYFLAGDPSQAQALSEISQVMNETIAGLRLFYAPEEQAAAREIGIANERSVTLIYQWWGLAAPVECRIYVMASWPRFLFHSAPWPWKVYLVLTWPLVVRRASSIWPYAGGWFLQYGQRRVVGVKPPRLIAGANQSLGEQIFLPDRDLTEKVHTVTCHELVHAFTPHLKLPTWLNEGLATLAMEHYLGRRIIREDTLENLTRGERQQPGPGRPEPLRVEKPQGLIAQYARGYWLTRYIEEARPELLRDLLSRRHRPEELEKKLAAGFGKDRYRFWQEIDGELLDWQELQKEEARA